MADGAREFGEVTAKLDALAASFEDFRSETRRWQAHCDQSIIERMGGRLDHHSGRLRKLEIWQGWIAGALAAMAVVWGMFRFAVDWWRK